MTLSSTFASSSQMKPADKTGAYVTSTISTSAPPRNVRQPSVRRYRVGRRRIAINKGRSHDIIQNFAPVAKNQTLYYAPTARDLHRSGWATRMSKSNTRWSIALLALAALLVLREPALGQASKHRPAAAPGPAAESTPGGGGRDVSVPQAVDAVVRPWMAKNQAPGVIVVVRRHGKTQFFPLGLADVAQGAPVTPDTIFELASITKVFTTTSLAIKVEAGRMRLADSIAEYIPLLRERGGDIKRVTLLELATHTSSLPRTPGVKRRRRDGTNAWSWNGWPVAAAPLSAGNEKPVLERGGGNSRLRDRRSRRAAAVGSLARAVFGTARDAQHVLRDSARRASGSLRGIAHRGNRWRMIRLGAGPRAGG